MKNLKLIYLSIFIALISLVSCTNDQPVVQEQQTTQSASARTAMQELKTHFNPDGTLSRDSNNGQSDNPTGNIYFDYCFDFEYPVTLAYNTGTTVTVNDFDGLINILVNMTDALYVDGIVFPFNVTVFNNNNVLEVQTINNEQEFMTLIDSCGFDQVDDCNCTDEFDPVCVAATDENGASFTVQFPNFCLAQCEGFTQNDVVACDSTVDPGTNQNDCFNFVYPIAIVVDGVTVNITDDNDWDTALYTAISFDFVYPFNVEMTADGAINTITTEDEFNTVIDTCFGQVDPCDCSDFFGPEVCINVNGEVISFVNMCFAECEGFTQADIVDCNDTNPTGCWTFVYPIELTVNGQATTVNNEAELLAITENPSAQYQPVYPFDVTIDGTQQTIETPNNFYEIGEWDNMCN